MSVIHSHSSASMLFKHRKKAGNSGLTLVEVMVSLLIFTAIVIIFSGSIVLSEKTAHMNGQYSQALSLCQHKIDEMRAVGFGQLTYDDLNPMIIDDSSTPNTPKYSFTDIDGVKSILSDATTTIDIKSPDDTSLLGSQVKQVVVAVSWRPVAQRTKRCTVSLTAYIANVE